MKTLRYNDTVINLDLVKAITITTGYDEEKETLNWELTFYSGTGYTNERHMGNFATLAEADAALKRILNQISPNREQVIM